MSANFSILRSQTTSSKSDGKMQENAVPQENCESRLIELRCSVNLDDLTEVTKY